MDGNIIYSMKLWHQSELNFRLCTKHRKEASMIPEDVSVGVVTNYSTTLDGSEYGSKDSRALMNHILTQVNLSPIRSQTRKRLSECSISGRRRLVTKFNNTIKVFQSML